MQATHRFVKFPWLPEPGGDTGSRSSGKEADTVAELPFPRLQNMTARAAAPPAAERSSPLRASLSVFPAKARESPPPGHASMHRRQRTQRSASICRSFNEMQFWGQFRSHSPHPVHRSPENRTETRGDVENSPRNVPTGHRSPQKGRPLRTDHTASRRKNAAVPQKSSGTKGTRETWGRAP